MATNDNPLIRSLVTKHGTGIAARANERGDHAMAAGLMDTYATNGQTIPANLAEPIRRLNEITQQETILAKSSAGGRAALSGTGYDPVAVRKEAADLERFLLENSADARNAGSRIAQETAGQNLRSLELQNANTAATLDAKNRAEILGFQEQASLSLANISEADAGAAVRASMDFVSETGASVDDLYEVFASNDPALMKAAFGTSDRVAAHGVMQFMQIATSEVHASRLKNMTAAASLRATELAGNPEVANEDLMAMLAGSMELPANTSILSVKEALQEREAVVQARTAMTQAQGDQKTTAEAFRAMAVDGMTGNDLAGVVVGALQKAGMDGPKAADVMQALAAGETADVAEALLAATNGGKDALQITTQEGTVIEVSAEELIGSMVARNEQREMRVAQSIMANERTTRYMRELDENKRIISTVEGMLGVPIPNEIGMMMEARFAEARTLYTQAAKATSPEARMQMEQDAMELMRGGRVGLFEYAERKGVTGAFLEDIKQGRFTADSTYKAGLVELLGSSGQSSNSILGRAVAPLLKEANVTQAQLQAWATSDSVNVADLGIEPARFTAVIDGIGFQALAAGSLDVIANNPVFEKLPDGVKAVLDDALQMTPEQMREQNVSSATVFKRLVTAVQVADGMMVRADREDVLAGGQSAYEQGELLQALSKGLNNNEIFVNAIAPNGKIDRATAALMTMYIGDRRPLETSGDNAVAFDDLANLSAKILGDSIRQEMVGASLRPVSASARSTIGRDTRRALKFAAITGEGVAGLGMPQETVKLRDEVTSAIETVYMRKIMNPSEDRSTFFGMELFSAGTTFPGGTGLPSATFLDYEVADLNEIIAQLEANGHTDSAAQLRNSWGK